MRPSQRATLVRALELRRYEAPLPSFAGRLHATVRRCRGLPETRICEQQFIFAVTDVTDAWYGPYGEPFGLQEPDLRQVTVALRTPCSLEELTRVTDVMHGIAPRACAALDGVVWDAAARSIGAPLWRFINPSAMRGALKVYASVLGSPPREREVVQAALLGGYDLAKVSVASANVERLRALRIPWEQLALDGHRQLTSDDVRAISCRARGIAWLEDPHALDDTAAWRQTSASWGDEWPAIAAGEDVVDARALVTVLDAHPVIGLANLEVEALGITHASRVLRWHARRRRGCLLHGRMPLVAAHLKCAYPGVVRAVESQLSFAGERLATLWDGEADERELIQRRLDRPGVGVAPSAQSKLVGAVRLL